MNIWYVVPIEAALGRKGLRFYPGAQSRSAGAMEKYREAWDLLQQPTVWRGRPRPRAGREE